MRFVIASNIKYAKWLGLVAALAIGILIGRIPWPVDHRFTDATGRKEVTCPAQTADTIVMVTLGQSNSANYLGHRYRAANERIINFWAGRCYVAQDPLLGATGDAGSQWVVLANKLIARHDFIVIVAIGNGMRTTSVADWNGALSSRYWATLDRLKAHYKATHFLWHQGEADAHRTADEYAVELGKVIAESKKTFPESRFYVSQASICRGPALHTVREGQRKVIQMANGVFPGPDTDRLDALEDRYDGCHFSMVGQEKIADMWNAILAASPQGMRPR